MSRNHSVTVIIQTRTKQEVATGSAIKLDSQYEITNADFSDEQVAILVATVIGQMDPTVPIPDGIITETPS